MTKSTTSLPLTIALHIPTYWTTEQAFAVFQLVDELREAIWQSYSLQIQDQYRDHLRPLPTDSDDDNIGDPPF
jgi:hypothetical protein